MTEAKKQTTVKFTGAETDKQGTKSGKMGKIENLDSHEPLGHNGDGAGSPKSQKSGTSRASHRGTNNKSGMTTTKHTGKSWMSKKETDAINREIRAAEAIEYG